MRFLPGDRGAYIVLELPFFPVDHGDLRYGFLEVFFVLVGGNEAHFLLDPVGQEHAGACVCHDAEADEDARLGRNALVPSTSVSAQERERRGEQGWRYILPDSH